MTDRPDPKHRRRLADLSVIATSALLLGGSVLVIARVDGQRPLAPAPAPVEVRTATTLAPVEVPVATAPAPGLAPAPRPAARRVVVVRRSRPS